MLILMGNYMTYTANKERSKIKKAKSKTDESGVSVTKIITLLTESECHIDFVIGVAWYKSTKHAHSGLKPTNLTVQCVID